MSDFQLNINSAYEKPKKEKLQEKPKKINYPKNKIRFSYYGNTIPRMIEPAIKIKGEEKEIITGMIANQMKKSYILFNEGSVDNNIIKTHLKQLSNNQLSLPDDFEFIRSSTIRQTGSNKRSFQKKKNYKKKK